MFINYAIILRWVLGWLTNALGSTAITTTGAVATGALTVTGALAASGNFAIATNKFTVTAASGNTVVAGTLNVTGATTLTGALSPNGGIIGAGPSASSPLFTSTIGDALGAVAYASLGNDTVGGGTGTKYYGELWLTANKTLTGINVLNGSIVGTDNLIVALATDDGTVVATSALAGALSAGANSFQQIAFTGTYAAKGGARYWVIVQTNGTTARIRTIAASTYLKATGTAAGVFGTLTTITPPTTFSANVGPIAYVY